jgi:hypothetical protein
MPKLNVQFKHVRMDRCIYLYIFLHIINRVFLSLLFSFLIYFQFLDFKLGLIQISTLLYFYYYYYY